MRFYATHVNGSFTEGKVQKVQHQQMELPFNNAPLNGFKIYVALYNQLPSPANQIVLAPKQEATLLATEPFPLMSRESMYLTLSEPDLRNLQYNCIMPTQMTLCSPSLLLTSRPI